LMGGIAIDNVIFLNVMERNLKLIDVYIDWLV
jgi:hypothetical protein